MLVRHFAVAIRLGVPCGYCLLLLGLLMRLRILADVSMPLGLVVPVGQQSERIHRLATAVGSSLVPDGWLVAPIGLRRFLVGTLMVTVRLGCSGLVAVPATSRRPLCSA
jgi:hypothetical protein